MVYTIMKNYSNTNNSIKIIKNESALLFPGQGSQVVGMGKEFLRKFQSCKKYF